MNKMVEAIRKDKLVGRGSCTSIDEAWGDCEVFEALLLNDVKTEKGAIEWARKWEGVWLDQCMDARAGEPDDKILETYTDWQKAVGEE